MEFASAIGEEIGGDVWVAGKADRKPVRYKGKKTPGRLSSIAARKNTVAEPRVQSSEAALPRQTYRIQTDQFGMDIGYEYNSQIRCCIVQAALR